MPHFWRAYHYDLYVYFNNTAMMCTKNMRDFREAHLVGAAECKTVGKRLG